MCPSRNLHTFEFVITQCNETFYLEENYNAGKYERKRAHTKIFFQMNQPSQKTHQKK